jgi:pre-mRNA-splicing factor RBM22/SLT11
MLELSSWTDIKGQRVKLLWGPTEKWQHKMTGAAISSTQEVGSSSSNTADLVTKLVHSLEKL